MIIRSKGGLLKCNLWWHYKGGNTKMSCIAKNTQTMSLNSSINEKFQWKLCFTNLQYVVLNVNFLQILEYLAMITSLYLLMNSNGNDLFKEFTAQRFQYFFEAAILCCVFNVIRTKFKEHSMSYLLIILLLF